MKKLIRTIEVGKKNKYNLPTREFTTADGKTTLYRFYYPCNDEVLCRVIDLVNKYNKEGLTFEELVEVCSYLWIVHHKNTKKSKSKLAGIKSISTSCLDNEGCIARMNDCTSICHFCYAGTQQDRQHGLQEHNIINGIILRNIAIPVEVFRLVLPFVNERFVRIESFGDVSNETQVKNYLSIMQAFPCTQFAAWTKVIFLWVKCFEQYSKPDNLSFVVSSCHVNLILSLPEKILKWIDHVFTVFDEKTVKKGKVKINCGGRSCMECIKAGKRCYFRGTDFQIFEEKK